MLRSIPWGNHVILDLESVERIGEAFAREVLFGGHGTRSKVVPINAAPGVQRMLARVYRSEVMRPSSSVPDGPSR